MTTPPMKTPRRRPPGFAETRPLADGVVARPAVAGAASASRETRTRETRSPVVMPAPAVDNDGGAMRDPYAGAATRQVNMRLFEPLHSRYMRLVRDLADDGYRTSLTEVMHAMLDTGPATRDEVRELVRAWRRRREP